MKSLFILIISIFFVSCATNDMNYDRSIASEKIASSISLLPYSHELSSIQFGLRPDSFFARTLIEAFTKSPLSRSNRKGVGLFEKVSRNGSEFLQERIVMRQTQTNVQYIFVINNKEKLNAGVTARESFYKILFSGKIAKDFSTFLKSMTSLDGIEAFTDARLKNAVVVYSDKEGGLNPKTHILCHEPPSGPACSILLNND